MSASCLLEWVGKERREEGKGAWNSNGYIYGVQRQRQRKKDTERETETETFLVWESIIRKYLVFPLGYLSLNAS